MSGKQVLLTTLLVFTVNLVRADEQKASPPRLVFLLIGQSNMAGRAALEPGDEKPMPGVLLLNDTGKWEPAANPLNRYASNRKTLTMQRIGPGDGFARRLHEAAPDVTIGLIVNARGGTSIEQWAKGKPLYENTMKRIKSAGSPKLAGILWHQGESNAKDADYPDKLVQLITHLRTDLKSPDLPFIAGQVAADVPVNQHIAALRGKLKNTDYAGSERLEVFDGVHFDRKSQRLLGQRYADAYLRMIKIEKK